MSAFSWGKSLVMRWEAFLLLLVVVTVVVGATTSPAFLTAANFSAASAGYTEIALIALPLMMIVIMGDIDLSVGSIVAMSSTVFGQLTLHDVPLGVSIVAVLLVGALAGALNALLVVGLKLPSLVVTLGTLTLYAGLARVILSQGGVSQFPDFVTSFGMGYIPRTLIPWSVVLVAVLVVPCAVILHKSRIGRSVYAIGGNAEAARFSGIRTHVVRAGLFIVSGLVASLAGLMLTARLSAASPDNGSSLVLNVLAAVLLGGVSVFGGKGNLAGVLLAIALLGTVQNTLNLHDVDSNAQQVVIGGLLICSVLATDGSARLRSFIQERLVRGRAGTRALGNQG
jgi:rhamnose transport system permease protein